jgi:serine/threonine protein kinase
MTSLRQCEVCGTDIAPGPLGDVCPVCLLREGHTEFAGLDVADALAAGASDFQDRGGLPRAFGGYDLLEEIAHGGMGIVYRARHRALNREVALKLLLAGAFASPDFVRRFQREAAAAASLRHPHIVGVYEVGEVDGQPFLAMEYVAGKTLAELVRERPLPARDAARYLQIVAEAVQHAHDHGLLHRDLKPSNVLVDLDDQPRVTDFGLAKQMDGSTDLTVTGQMLGSPNYLSPEAALGNEAQLTPASDVYSLGATLYHLLTGRPPLLAGSLAETLVRVREETAIAPRLLNPSVPADVDTICLKCLEKEPARRYSRRASSPTNWAAGCEANSFARGPPLPSSAPGSGRGGIPRGRRSWARWPWPSPRWWSRRCGSTSG